MRPSRAKPRARRRLTRSLPAPAPARGDAFLTLDGQTSRPLVPGDRIRITRAPGKLSLAMLPDVSFFEVLRQKLKWSGSAVEKISDSPA